MFSNGKFVSLKVDNNGSSLSSCSDAGVVISLGTLKLKVLPWTTLALSTLPDADELESLNIPWEICRSLYEEHSWMSICNVRKFSKKKNRRTQRSTEIVDVTKCTRRETATRLSPPLNVQLATCLTRSITRGTGGVCAECCNITTFGLDDSTKRTSAHASSHELMRVLTVTLFGQYSQSNRLPSIDHCD